MFVTRKNTTDVVSIYLSHGGIPAVSIHGCDLEYLINVFVIYSVIVFRICLPVFVAVSFVYCVFALLSLFF